MSKQLAYSDDSFWDKVESSAKVAGRETLRPALQLYYAQEKDETPVWAKALIYAGTRLFHHTSRCRPRPDLSRRYRRYDYCVRNHRRIHHTCHQEKSHHQT